MRILNSKNKKESLKELQADQYLDNSKKGAYLNNEVLFYLKDYLQSLDKELYQLVAFSIMPNHLHILFKQMQDLDKTIKQIKGSSAITINKMLNKKGTFWAKGYYDKAIRDEKHFLVTYNYIKNNAIKANLKDAKDRFYGVYD